MPSLQVLAFAIFTVLLKHPAYYYERLDVCAVQGCAAEASTARESRLEHDSRVMARAALKPRGGLSSWEQAAVLLAHGQAETNWARYVGEGHCDKPPDPRAPRCDPHPKTGEPQARTYFQVHQARCPRAWEKPQGSPDELYEASLCTVSGFIEARGRCRGRHPQGELAGAFSGLALGLRCTWPKAGKRALRYGQILVELQR